MITAKDFATDQEVRWCPGCGDYSILKQVQTIFAQLELNRDETAIISGIGCSSRFPYYMNTYGMHSIHGRATTIASGLKIANPALNIWIITGDGDGLSIGGNHLMHLLRRNVDVRILLFNNQIYGLTKGQYSPTSEEKKLTKSSPSGVVDHPVNPLAFALGSDATFVARTLDRDPAHLREVLLRAQQHKGSSFVEIYQNCNIFNDGAFEIFTEKETKPDHTILLRQGEPLLFGKNMDKGIRLNGTKPEMVELNDGFTASDLWIHDEKDPFKAYMLSRFFDHTLPRPLGVLYSENRPCYEDVLEEQIRVAIQTKGKGNIQDLLRQGMTWTVK
jgi:2-oxoglutarate/2-oxoacid ferredoxin oxidoreductase subunit beta